MNSEWKENASRTRGCAKKRETNECSGRSASSRTMLGTSRAKSVAERNGRRPAARMPSR